MAKAAQLEIEILAKAEQAIGELDKMKAKAGDSFSVTRAAALAAGTGIAVALADATKKAADHEVQVAKVEQAYRNVGLPMSEAKKSLEEVDAASRKTGLSTDDSVAAFGRLVTATHSTEEANKDLALAQDLSVAKGISVSQAGDDIIRANAGQTRALKELGIATTDATGKQLSHEQVMKNLTDAVHGQAAAYGQTAEGGMARFHQSTEQLQVAIGTALLPALERIINALMPLFDWLGKNQQIVGVLVPIIAALGGTILVIVEAIKIWTAVQEALNLVMSMNPIGLVILAVAALTVAIILAYQHVAVFRDAVDAVGRALEAVGRWILGNWRLIVDVLLGPVGLIITNLGTVERVIGDIIGGLESIGRAASNAFGWLGKVASVGGGILGAIGLSAPPGGPVAAPVAITIYATPGDNLPEVVYDALRSYQRRHARAELAPMFGR